MTSPKIVLRITRSTLSAINKIKGHEKRTAGDLRHVDFSRTHLNRVLIGSGDPARDVRSRIKFLKTENLKEELQALKSKSRHKAAAERQAQGLKNPWDDKTTKLLTEGLLSASPDFFDRPERIEEFIQVSKKWLQDTFGDSVVSASIHLDERTPHCHFQILPTVVKTSARRGTQRIISHNTHPAFREAPDQVVGAFELLQDSVGEAFAGLGIQRGEKRAELARLTEFFGSQPAPAPKNVSPREWHAQRRAEAILEAAEAKAAEREAEAQAEAAKAQAEAAKALQEASQVRDAAKADAHEIRTDARVAASKTREEAKAFAAAVSAGAEAVVAEQVVWKEPTERWPRGSLKAGPAFPKDKAKGEALGKALLPAWEWIAGFAHRFGLMKAEKDAQAQATLQMDRQRLQAEAQANLDAERAQVAQERAQVQGERSQVNAARGAVESERLKVAIDSRTLDARRTEFLDQVREAGPALARAKAEAERQGRRDEAERLAALSASLRRRPEQRERDER